MSGPAPAGALPLGGGIFVAVVGPSGAGKDSVIAFARARLADEPRVHFARRVITRPSDPAAEDHDTLGEAAFAEAEGRGAFALTWSSHGLRYGIPAGVDGAIAAGGVAVANLSRGVIPDLRRRYDNIAVVQVTATPDVLAGRLSSRGRESGEQVSERLARNLDYVQGIGGVFIIDNSGPLPIAGQRFLGFLREQLSACALRQR